MSDTDKPRKIFSLKTLEMVMVTHRFLKVSKITLLYGFMCVFFPPPGIVNFATSH